METQNFENTAPAPQTEPGMPPYAAGAPDADTMMTVVGMKLAQSNKLLREAVGITLFISIVNILLGAVATFLPLFIADSAFAGYNGTALAVYGLIFMGMALGIHKRSRACAIIALVIFALDTLLTIYNTIVLISAGGGVQIVSYAMKVVIFIGLIAGIRGCFQYHSLVQTYSAVMDNRPIEMIRQNTRKTNPAVLAVCAVIAAVGVAAAAFGIVQTIQNQNVGTNFEDWQTYTTADGMVSMKIPSAETIEDSEMLDAGGGITVSYETMQSDGSKCSTFLLAYNGILATQELKDISAQLEEEMLTSFITGGNLTLLDDITSVPMGDIDCLEVSMEMEEGLPGKIRIFSHDSNIYMALIVMNSADGRDSELIDQFMNSITVNP